MGTEQKEPILIFFSYAQRDRILRYQLEDHLYILKYRKLIEMWDAYEIRAGDDKYQQANTYLEKAQIILLLISASFIASDFLESSNVQRMLERHNKGYVTIIPILLRSTYLVGLPFAHIAMLPTNKKPVAEWKYRDRAFVDIVAGIERVIDSYIAKQRSGTTRGTAQDAIIIPETTTRGGDGLSFYPELFDPTKEIRNTAYYKQSLDIYQHALIVNSTDSQAYRGKGHALYGLERYQEAFEAFTRAAQLHPTPANAVSKGKTLVQLARYEAALHTYREALDIDPGYAAAYYEISAVQLMLGQTREAQETYKRAVQIGYDE